MGKEYSVEFRGKAVGMVLAGMDRKHVCKRLGISRTQLYDWLKREKTGEGLKSKAGRGRKPSVHPVAKRVIAMSVTKRRQSTRRPIYDDDDPSDIHPTPGYTDASETSKITGEKTCRGRS